MIKKDAAVKKECSTEKPTKIKYCVYPLQNNLLFKMGRPYRFQYNPVTERSGETFMDYSLERSARGCVYNIEFISR